jgi:hypothetical protein
MHYCNDDVHLAGLIVVYFDLPGAIKPTVKAGSNDAPYRSYNKRKSPEDLTPVVIVFRTF